MKKKSMIFKMFSDRKKLYIELSYDDKGEEIIFTNLMNGEKTSRPLSFFVNCKNKGVSFIAYEISLYPNEINCEQEVNCFFENFPEILI